jgi:hypothetical protein
MRRPATWAPSRSRVSQTATTTSASSSASALAKCTASAPRRPCVRASSRTPRGTRCGCSPAHRSRPTVGRQARCRSPPRGALRTRWSRSRRSPRQRRCAPTTSDTEPFACTRRRPTADGRSTRAGRLIKPCSVNCSIVVADRSPTRRATGTPRSVTTISSPARARSSQSPSCARNTVTGTSMCQLYTDAHLECTVGLRIRSGRGCWWRRTGGGASTSPWPRSGGCAHG